MHRFLLTTVSLISLLLANIVSAQTLCPNIKNPIDTSVPIKLISEQLLFLEGITWSEKQQAFYFSEMDFSGEQSFGPSADIYQLKLPQDISLLIKNSGTNGLFAKGDHLYAARHFNQSISTFNLVNKSVKVIATQHQNKNFNSPNDLIIGSGGDIYFSDPDWQLGTRHSQTQITGLYWLKTNGEVELIDASLQKPNGVALSVDGKRLFVGDASNTIFVYRLDETGKPTQRREFAKVTSPDGIAVDCADNLYIASHNNGSIEVLSKTGTYLQSVYIANKITNLEFGGENKQQIIVTTGQGLYAIRGHIPGK